MKHLFSMMVLGTALTCGAQQVFTPGNGPANDQGQYHRAQDVSFIPRNSENGYGYRNGFIPVGFTFLPWVIPNHEYSMYGFRLNLGWAAYREMIGLDTGVFSLSGDAAGIQVNLFGNATAHDMQGLEIGLVNVAGRKEQGLQIGLVNYAQHLEGVQIGLINIAREQWTLPILNVAF